MISVRNLTKRYGSTTALGDVSCDVQAGCVTGLLGPNGAGKSTLMRVVVGLDHPCEGEARVSGVRYGELSRPLSVVGAHLGGSPWHPRRSGRAHLVAVARANRISVRRVDEVLEMAGLRSVARRRTGGYSLGMGQRLGLASALLGDPRIIMLDEPVNGLDTDGVRWIRGLLRAMADQGKAVLVSSHLMTEMQLVADQVIVLGRGRVLADVPMADLARRGGAEVVLLTERGTGVRRLVAALPDSSSVVEVQDELARVRVSGLDEAVVGRAAHQAGVPVLHLSARAADLESGYLDLVAGEGDFVAEGEVEHVG